MRKTDVRHIAVTLTHQLILPVCVDAVEDYNRHLTPEVPALKLDCAALNKRAKVWMDASFFREAFVSLLTHCSRRAHNQRLTATLSSTGMQDCRIGIEYKKSPENIRTDHRYHEQPPHWPEAARRIIEQHRSRIDFDAGEGTERVVVRLPYSS
jgi:hypothetical protein